MLFLSIGASKSDAAQISFCMHHLMFNIRRVTIYITHLGGISQGVREVPCDDDTGCIKNCGGYLNQLCTLMARRTLSSNFFSLSSLCPMSFGEINLLYLS